MFSIWCIICSALKNGCDRHNQKMKFSSIRISYDYCFLLYTFYFTNNTAALISTLYHLDKVIKIFNELKIYNMRFLISLNCLNCIFNSWGIPKNALC